MIKLNRNTLIGRMKEMTVRKNLMERVAEKYEKTKTIIRKGENEKEEFWTSRGVRQGCPVSPTLFNVYISDLEKEAEVLGKRKVRSLMYADDVALLATLEV